jgi:hypothetical protein
MRRFASLPFDVARCVGTNCTKKNTCARHKQIGRDADNPNCIRVVMTDALRDGGHCEIRIEELDDGR